MCAGNEELVTYLLARGANPEAIDNASYTPIDEAKRRGFPSILNILKMKYDLPHVPIVRFTFE